MLRAEIDVYFSDSIFCRRCHMRHDRGDEEMFHLAIRSSSFKPISRGFYTEYNTIMDRLAEAFRSCCPRGRLGITDSHDTPDNPPGRPKMWYGTTSE